MNSIFTEVPVEVQISCNLEPCRLNKIIIMNCCLYEEAIPRTGKQEIYLEWPYKFNFQSSLFVCATLL